MFVIPHGPPESYQGYEWFVALLMLVGFAFTVRDFVRARTRTARNGSGRLGSIGTVRDWKKRVGPWLSRLKTQRVDPAIERDFKNVFMTASKEGKEALIQRWINKKQCSRSDAMRLAVEEWRRDNR
jgi:hypothetical protein